MSTAAIRQKRQTTLPVDVSEAAGLQPGDEVDWRFEAGEIRGRRVERSESEEIDFMDVDPESLLPRGATIIVESIAEAVRAGREK